MLSFADVCYKPDAYITDAAKAEKVELFNKGWGTVSPSLAAQADPPAEPRPLYIHPQGESGRRLEYRLSLRQASTVGEGPQSGGSDSVLETCSECNT